MPPPSGEVDSIVSISHLSFGTVTGFCAGVRAFSFSCAYRRAKGSSGLQVFVKKGLMIVAFFLGGGFVLLQVCPSQYLCLLFLCV